MDEAFKIWRSCIWMYNIRMRKNRGPVKAASIGLSFGSTALLFCILTCLGILFSTPLYAKAVKKNTMDLCIECHPGAAAMSQKENVHMPVRLGLCTACHNPHASKHSGLLGYKTGELCFNCHDPRKGFTGEVVHQPVGQGNCLACHDAHSTDAPGLLKKGMGQGCFECHPKKELLAKKNVHPEVEKGNCLACHDPHASSIVGLLGRDKLALCIQCHGTESVEFVDSHMGYEVSGTDCLGCHTAHSSDRVAMLKATLHKPFEDKNCTGCHRPDSWEPIKAGIGLCTECHKNSMPGFNRINSHLVAGVTDNVCASCHNPHASDEKNLFKDKEDRVCYACHNDTKEYAAASNHRHPKLADCSDCHTSHGSNNRFFLAQGDDTCSTEECHPTQGVFTHPVGEEVIDPRSKAPMNCSTCHNPMGSPEEQILRLGKEMELCIQCHQM
jgi:predicted CXXCH cytochrome family protein